MAIFHTLGPEPEVLPGDHLAAKYRADRISDFLMSEEAKGLTRTEKRLLRRKRTNWLRRFRGQSEYFELFGNMSGSMKVEGYHKWMKNRKARRTITVEAEAERGQ